MKYVDGFVLPVKKSKLKDYRKLAAASGKIWKKHGALEYFECVGDDLNPKMSGEGNMPAPFMNFTKLAKTKPGETVVFSFIVYNSRKHRDSVNAKVMNDPFMNGDNWKDKPMPFDMKRIAYGGFKAIVEG